jgi:hypothetical protein
MKKQFALLIILCLAMLACELSGNAPSSQDLAATIVAETDAAASPTPLPSETPLPTATPLPTNTPSPTAPPTNTPTITPTPGPVVFNDDFSSDSGNWKGCKECQWSAGSLMIGPFPAQGDTSAQARKIICIPCGEKTYFRMAADFTFVDGYTDRFYGLLVGDGEKYSTILGISPLQVAVLARQKQHSNDWDLLNASGEKIFNTLIRSGKQVNHLEIIVKPSGVGAGDIYMNLNGKTSFVAYKVEVEAAEVGIYLDWHSIGIAVDNFEFEELEP